MSDGFTVRGELDDTLYEVKITGNVADPVVGSDRVKGLFRQYDGKPVLATPQGPKYIVNGADPTSVLAMLSEYTKVESVGGAGETVPSLVDPRPAGAVR